jgi:hypothetical protein
MYGSIKLRGAMKSLNKILILVLLVFALLIPFASADPIPGNVSYVEGSRALQMREFISVSLGIEDIPGVTIAQAVQYYNWISIGILFLIGAMSSKRMTRFFAILVPIFAAIFVIFGWLHYVTSVGGVMQVTIAQDVQTWATIVMCALIGIITYMKGSLKENFGGSGSGNLLLNIVFYIIILQVIVGVVNSTAIWEHATSGQTNIISNTTFDQTYALNADLSKSVPSVSNTGGMLSALTGAASMAAQVLWGCVMMLLSVIGSIACFAVVVLQIYPWIGDSPVAMLLLGAIQLGIYFVYTMYFINAFGGRPLETTSF